MDVAGNSADGTGRLLTRMGAAPINRRFHDSWRYSWSRCESRELEVEHDDKKPWMGFTMENLQASELVNLKWEKAAINGRGRGLKKANGGRTGGTGPSNSRLQRIKNTSFLHNGVANEVAFSNEKRADGP